MGSFYQRVTGRRQQPRTARSEDTTPWVPPKDEGASQQIWDRESRDVSRSRSRTMTSAMSFYAASNSDSSNASSQALSPHLTRDKRIPSLEEKGRPTKQFGRMLRKHASKLSLSSALHAMDGDAVRPVTAIPAYGPKDHKHPVEALRREEIKRAISDPFEFRHVTHTDRGFLNSVERVSKTELVGEFSALRAGQASKPELRGIRVDALPAQKPAESAPVSPITKPDVEEKPTPPPKDEPVPPSPAQCLRMSMSVDNLSRSKPSIASITPPRRYSSRRALQHPLISPSRPLGAYIHTPSHSVDANGTDTDLCINCNSVSVVDDKPLPLPPVHALTTDDESARHLRAAPLPPTPTELADVIEECETKRLSALVPRPSARSLSSSVSTDNNSDADSDAAAENSVTSDDVTASPSNHVFVVDAWDDAIDDSWDHATDPEGIASQCPSSMSAQVTCFVDKAMLRLAGPEQSKCSQPPPSPSLLLSSRRSSSQQSEAKLSTSEQASPNASHSSPLLGLGIELQQSSQNGSDPCTTPTPTLTSVVTEGNERGSSLTASFKSDFSNASGLSKCSSQESIIWSIASSIIGTQRSSNSSNSILEHSPDYPRAAKSIDDLKEALESVQEHLQDIHEEQTTQHGTASSSPTQAKQNHQRARSLATGFVFGSGSPDVARQRPTTQSGGSPRASYGHQRIPSGSRIPIPARKSSANQNELNMTPARRQRAATTVSRPKHVSRPSYSLFPGA